MSECQGLAARVLGQGPGTNARWPAPTCRYPVSPFVVTVMAWQWAGPGPFQETVCRTT